MKSRFFACRPQDGEHGVCAKIIAEGKRHLRNRRQGGAQTKSFCVYEIQDEADALSSDAVLHLKAIAAGMVYGNIAHNAREDQRLLFHWHPAMTKVDGRRLGEAENGQQGLEVMLSVNDIGGSGDSGEIVNHRDGCSPEPFSNRPQHRAEGDGLMAAFLQFDGDIVDVKLASGPVVQGVVSQ